MHNYLEDFFFFLSLFVLIFIIDYFFINKRKLNLINNKGVNKKGKKKKIKTIGELEYLTFKFKLNEKLLDKNKVILWVSILNSFIISFTSSIILLIPMKLIWQLLIAFVLLFALIYSLYEIYGRHLKNNENRKE